MYRYMCAVVALTLVVGVRGILYPRSSSSRDVRSLDGVWSFRTSPTGHPSRGFQEHWYRRRLEESGPVLEMPVPSSFNDITADRDVRDYIGWVWYDRQFHASRHWSTSRVVLRFGSVNYITMVWLNGKPVPRGFHEGGHLPFEMDVHALLNFDSGGNWVTVAVNNTLNPHSIPQGHITFKNDTDLYPPGFFEQSLNFGYFHYAGIHRSVQLYTTPKQTYIDDVVISTNFTGHISSPTAHVRYTIHVSSTTEKTADHQLKRLLCFVKVRDHLGKPVPSRLMRLTDDENVISGMVSIENATLWWPYRMSSDPGRMYMMEVVCVNGQPGETESTDVHLEPFGVRSLQWDSDRLYINGRPLYLRGFGKHEDANVVGRGLHVPLMVRDINLLRWSGANVFRTSHYPYSEELLDLTDRAGILVIAESPAIGLAGFDDLLLSKHQSVMKELVQRDKNRASVFLWSLGNEPQSSDAAAGPYFSAVYNWTRQLDATRPITTVVAQPYSRDQAAGHMDVILVNRYFSWYSDSGRTEVVQRQIEHDLRAWRGRFGKPVGVSEYGAGSVPGLRDLPEFIWTEDYQVVFLQQYHRGFDQLRKHSWFLGEMVWNFADFAMPPEYIRPQFCMKGVFTRERKPKMAAYIIRNRYMSIED